MPANLSNAFNAGVAFMLTGSAATAGIWIAAIGILSILIRQIGPWNKQQHAVEVQLRDDMFRRIRRLELTLERERAIHKAEAGLDRHRLNNVTACFDALLLLIEMAPEKAKESVQKIKEMRATQIESEANEKAIIRAAEIAAQQQIDAEIDDLGGEDAAATQPAE